MYDMQQSTLIGGTVARDGITHTVFYEDFRLSYIQRIILQTTRQQ